jgi:putative ABC transport system permease protein
MLYVRVAENPYDRAHVLAVANQVRDLFEKDRHLVINFWLPAALGKNPAYDISSTIVLIMGALSLLIVFVSGFLVTSTVSALLARQTRQIGIMKAIGGDTPQIVGMYLLVILLIALVAVGIGVPLGAMGARAMSRFVGDFINFDIGDWSIPSYVYYVQAALGIGVPLLAGLAPVLAGSRITVLQAINDYGTSDGKRAGLVTRILQRVHGLPRPTMLSIRNTFRKKGRLALILITLSLGSGNFISVASVYASTVRTLDEASAFWRYDYEINLPAPRSAGRLMLEMGRIENVSRVEAWLTNNVYRERSDGTISENLQAIGLPPKTEAIYPVLLEGRWLAQDDTNAIVIDTNLLRNEPDIKLNDSVDLKIEGELTTWRVVGISRGQPGAPIAYMNYDHLVSLLPKSLGKANALRLTFANDLIEQDRTVLLAAIDKRTALIDVGVPTYKTVQQLRADSERQFNFILIFLLVMAILLAGVGMIGLTGTMSMNVIERTKEIGIMRAIGASNADIMNVFIVEGIVIATLAWLIGVALAVPVSRAMSDAVGIAFMRTPLSYSFSLPGVGIWIALMVALAALACFAPARAASSLTIREVLAYE